MIKKNLVIPKSQAMQKLPLQKSGIRDPQDDEAAKDGSLINEKLHKAG